MLTLLLTTAALAYAPHCEVTGHFMTAKKATSVVLLGMPGEKKLDSGKTGDLGSFKLRFWESERDKYTSFVVRAVGKGGKKLAESGELKFSFDPGDCKASVEF